MGSPYAFTVVHRRHIVRKALFLSFVIASGLSSRRAVGQENSPYTFHVYTNLAQQPALVLDQNNNPLPPYTREQFDLSLDHGPLFHPTHIRLEGDDPITLFVLLDASGRAANLMKVASNAIASLASLSLTPRDHVAIFAFDCAVSRGTNLVAGDSETLTSSVRDALEYPGIHGPKNTAGSCFRSRRLWDALATLTNAIAAEPGRRVVVALTDGVDHDSKDTWNEVRENAVNKSVAIFGIRGDSFVPPTALGSSMATPGQIGTASYNDPEDRFELLCHGSGGIVLEASAKALPKTLQHVIELLRGRYILEYPRPSNVTSGFHLIDIKVPQRGAVVIGTGVSMKLATAKEVDDPNTIPPDPSRAPTLGTRKPMSH